jgi:hypothetical protein
MNFFGSVGFLWRSQVALIPLRTRKDLTTELHKSKPLLISFFLFASLGLSTMVEMESCY